MIKLRSKLRLRLTPFQDDRNVIYGVWYMLSRHLLTKVCYCRCVSWMVLDSSAFSHSHPDWTYWFANQAASTCCALGPLGSFRQSLPSGEVMIITQRQPNRLACFAKSVLLQWSNNTFLNECMALYCMSDSTHLFWDPTRKKKKT